MKQNKDNNPIIGLDLGLGGIFKGIGSLLDIASKLAEEAPTEVTREGQVGDDKGFKAVYGFSVKVGGEGFPTVESFGNVHDKGPEGPVVDEVREPMTDVFDEGEFLLVMAEMPGVKETDIKYEIKGDILTISGQTGDRKYYKEQLLSTSVDEEKISHSFNNGILEVKLWKTQKQ